MNPSKHELPRAALVESTMASPSLESQPVDVTQLIQVLIMGASLVALFIAA